MERLLEGLSTPRCVNMYLELPDRAFVLFFNEFFCTKASH